MELKEFVTAALLGVIDGVAQAQQQLGERGKYINPRLSTQQGDLQRMGHKISAAGLIVHSVEFDIGVVITQSSSSTSQPSIGVVSDAGASTALERAGHNRMKFSIPIILPSN